MHDTVYERSFKGSERSIDFGVEKDVPSYLCGGETNVHGDWYRNSAKDPTVLSKIVHGFTHQRCIKDVGRWMTYIE